MGFSQQIDVTVSIDESDLEDNGYHHESDCPGCENTHIEDIESFTQPHHAAVDALHDWHETAHGYTLWSICQQEPCKLLTLDYRKRT